LFRKYRVGWVSVAIIAVMLGIMGAGAAMAKAPLNPLSGEGVISAAYQKVNGMLRLVNGAEDVNPSEVFIQWSQQGPKGDKGDTGAKGDNGNTGPQGPPGPTEVGGWITKTYSGVLPWTDADIPLITGFAGGSHANIEIRADLVCGSWASYALASEESWWFFSGLHKEVVRENEKRYLPNGAGLDVYTYTSGNTIYLKVKPGTAYPASGGWVSGYGKTTYRIKVTYIHYKDHTQ